MNDKPIVICQREDTQPDMYPEFSKTPVITIHCTSEAVVYIEERDAINGVWSEHYVVCANHALEQVMHYLSNGDEFKARTITDEDRRDYLRGSQLAADQEITEREALIACHEGLAEAGLDMPVGSDLFAAGWTWTMSERIADITWRAERLES